MFSCFVANSVVCLNQYTAKEVNRVKRPYISEIFLQEPPTCQSYLIKIPAVQHLMREKTLPITENVTIFVGENGTGKSTLIEAIAVAFGFNAEGGSRNFSFSTADTHSELAKHLILAKQNYPKDGFFLRAESYYNVASYIDEVDRQPAAAPPIIGGYGGVSLHEQSHGESFMALVQHRFAGNGLYILDEPEAALSPSRILTLMAEMSRLVQCDSQFIVATHSPLLMAFPNACIYQIAQNGIERVDYRDTEHYRITRAFLENPEKLLRTLLEE